MTLKQHQKEVKKLKALEAELTSMVIKLGDDELTQLYLDWQHQRNVCNEGFIKYVHESLKKE